MATAILITATAEAAGGSGTANGSGRAEVLSPDRGLTWITPA
jgi:hypothetical protein